MAWTIYLLTMTMTAPALQSTADTGLNMTSSLNALLTLMTLMEITCGEIHWCAVSSQNVNLPYKGGCCRRCFCHPECVRSHTCCPDFRLSELLQRPMFTSAADLRSALSNATLSTTELDLSPYNKPANQDLSSTNTAETDFALGDGNDQNNDSGRDDVPATSGNRTTAECIHARLLNVSPNRPKSSSYLMVARCPVSDVDDITKTRCESPRDFIENGTIRDFIPVQSAATGVVYRNIFCSLCNFAQVDTLINWDVYVASLDYPSKLVSSDQFSTMEDLFSFIVGQEPCYFGSYDLLFEPGEALMRNNSPDKCHDVDVTSCDVDGGTDKTGGNDTSDIIELRNACRTFFLPVYISIDSTFTVFNNLACVLCNDHDLDAGSPNGRCGHYNRWEEWTPYVGRILNEHIARRLENKADSTEIQRMFSLECDLGYIFDSRLDGCRKVYCPCGMVVHEGRCVFIFEDIPDKLYQVDVDIALPSPPTIEPRTANSAIFQRTLFQYFTNIFKRDDLFLANHIVLMATKGRNPNPKKYFARVIFSKMDNCTSTFRDAVGFVAKTMAGTKHITGAGVGNFVTLSVTDLIRTHKRQTTIHRATGDTYEEVLSISSDPSSDRRLLLKNNMIILTECLYCYMVKLLDGEVQTGLGIKAVLIKPTRTFIVTRIMMHSDNETGYLACADNVIVRDVVKKNTTPPAGDNDDGRTELPYRDDEETNDIGDIEMGVAWLSMGLVVVLIFSLRLCMKRWLQSRQNN